MVAYEKESAVQRNLFHAFGVKTDSAYKDQVPCRTDEEPPVKAAVFIVKLLRIYEA